MVVVFVVSGVGLSPECLAWLTMVVSHGGLSGREQNVRDMEKILKHERNV